MDKGKYYTLAYRMIYYYYNMDVGYKEAAVDYWMEKLDLKLEYTNNQGFIINITLHA